MNNKDKYEYIKSQAKLLEEEADRKELMLKVNNNSEEQAKGTSEVNDYIIDSIKAKLSILDEM